MGSLSSDICFALSRRMLRPPAQRVADPGAYDRWRQQHLAQSWSAFSDAHIRGKDVLDFGCGDGQLALHLAGKGPRSITGVDLNEAAIERARRSGGGAVEFLVGSTAGVPLADASIDTITAFDCLEHVMTPTAIMRDWFRVLRPGGRVLLEWYPYRGPWGPHMESLIPIPWAHLLFGQRAMFRTFERIYDLPEFVPRHWDLDANGDKRPNKWRAWSLFREQGYINELTVAEFRAIADDVGLRIDRFDARSFGGNALRRGIGAALMRLPLVGECFMSFATIELLKPAAD